MTSVLVVLLAGLGVAVAGEEPGYQAVLPVPQTDGGPAPPRNERALMETARSFFEDGAWSTAGSSLEDFLKCYPSSRLAAEALYRLSLAQLLDGKPDEARKTQDRLVAGHPDSPWARTVLRVHLDEKGLLSLARQRYEKAGADRRPADAEAARTLLDLYRERFPQGELKGPGLVYRLGICYLLAGNSEGFRAAMEALTAHEEQAGDWAALARFRLGGAEEFAQGMEKLSRLATDGEECKAFLELADHFEPQLDNADRVRCQFFRACCLAWLERPREAGQAWRRLLAEHPGAPEAPEAAFWLARHHLGTGDVARARLAYAALARDYPRSPRARDARRWARWLDDHDEAWGELEQVLDKLLQSAQVPDASFAFDLRAACGRKQLRARVAYQGREHFLLRLQAGKGGFVLAGNAQGGWYARLRKRVVTRTPGPLYAALPRMAVREDPATGKLSFSSWARTEGDDGPLMSFPPSLAGRLVTALQGQFHLTRSTHGPVTVYRLESPRWEPGAIDVLKVEVAGQMPGSVSWSVRTPAGEEEVLSLSGLIVGQKLPESAFEVDLGDDFREVPARPDLPFNVLAEVFRLAGTVVKSLQDEQRKVNP
jgi:TolA-binding protein